MTYGIRPNSGILESLGWRPLGLEEVFRLSFACPRQGAPGQGSVFQAEAMASRQHCLAIPASIHLCTYTQFTVYVRIYVSTRNARYSYATHTCEDRCPRMHLYVFGWVHKYTSACM